MPSPGQLEEMPTQGPRTLRLIHLDEKTGINAVTGRIYILENGRVTGHRETRLPFAHLLRYRSDATLATQSDWVRRALELTEQQVDEGFDPALFTACVEREDGIYFVDPCPCCSGQIKQVDYQLVGGETCKIFQCQTCQAHVHSAKGKGKDKSVTAIGTVGHVTLRVLRLRLVEEQIDPLSKKLQDEHPQQKKGMRALVLQALTKAMGIPENGSDIGLFTSELCLDALELFGAGAVEVIVPEITTD